MAGDIGRFKDKIAALLTQAQQGAQPFILLAVVAGLAQALLQLGHLTAQRGVFLLQLVHRCEMFKKIVRPSHDGGTGSTERRGHHTGRIVQKACAAADG